MTAQHPAYQGAGLTAPADEECNCCIDGSLAHRHMSCMRGRKAAMVAMMHCRLGLLAAVLGSGDIHLIPVPQPTALDRACLPPDTEVCAALQLPLPRPARLHTSYIGALQSTHRHLALLRRGQGREEAMTVPRWYQLPLPHSCCLSNLVHHPPALLQESGDASGQDDPRAEEVQPPLARLGGGVVLAGSRTKGSLPSVASWLPIAPHDLLLVRLDSCTRSLRQAALTHPRRLIQYQKLLST